MKAQIVIVKLIVLGALFIISEQNLYLTVASDRAIFFNVYSSWVREIFNQAAQVTGYVVRLDWLPRDFTQPL